MATPMTTMIATARARAIARTIAIARTRDTVLMLMLIMTGMDGSIVECSSIHVYSSSRVRNTNIME